MTQNKEVSFKEIWNQVVLGNSCQKTWSVEKRNIPLSPKDRSDLIATEKMHDPQARSIANNLVLFHELSEELKKTTVPVLPSIEIVTSSQKSNLSEKKLKSRLKSFTSKDPSREHLRNAQTIDGITYATDNYRLIGIRTEFEDGILRFDDSFVEDKFPNVLRVIPEKNNEKFGLFKGKDLKKIAEAAVAISKFDGNFAMVSFMVFKEDGIHKIGAIGKNDRDILTPILKSSPKIEIENFKGYVPENSREKTKKRYQNMTVNARYLFEALKGLKDKDIVRVQITDKVRIDRPDGEFNIIMPLRDPGTSALEETTSYSEISCNLEILKERLNAYEEEKEELKDLIPDKHRPILNGLEMQWKGKSLVFTHIRSGRFFKASNAGHYPKYKAVQTFKTLSEVIQWDVELDKMNMEKLKKIADRVQWAVTTNTILYDIPDEILC